jgi:SAM-dependent methyltransferase
LATIRTQLDRISARRDAMNKIDATTETVRRRYAELATAATQAGTCCSADEQVVFGTSQYRPDDLAAVPATAGAASLGCGNPTAVAELAQGEMVLDLGSGGGIDVILSARRVGPTGKTYGLDMTDEMLDLARANAAEAGITNVEFLKGHIEAIPLPDASVDVVISNCVINLSTDKPAVLREAFRVLRPGGRFAITDVVADPDMDDATRADIDQWTGCIAGALTRNEYSDLLRHAGFDDIEIIETHRVHEHAVSSIVRARKPSSSDAIKRGDDHVG